MNTAQAPERSVVQLVYWSAALTTLITGVFLISLLIPNLTLMYGSSFLLAPAFVSLMAALHKYAPHEKAVYSQLGLSFATIYAVMCSLAYYIQLTFIRNNYLPITEDSLLPFVFIPGTPIFAQDMLGYVFMCAATLSTAPIFKGGRLENWIKWLFIFNAVLFIVPTIVIPAIPLPVNEDGSGLGSKVGIYANIVWAAYFACTSLLVTIMFKRIRKYY